MGAAPDREKDRAVVERRVEGGVIVLTDPDGSVRVEQVSPEVVLSVMNGRHTEGLARAMSTELESVIERVGSIHNFYDGWAQDSQDASIRSYWQTWATKHRGRLLSNQMLYRPKNAIATMAATVANLVLGGSLTIHTSQASFAAAHEAARRRPART